MKTSALGCEVIERREGRRLTAYRDTRGILTIGVGHTGRMSRPRVVAGMKITEAQCDAMLATDLAPVEETIAHCVTIPITQNEFDALASLGFNIGTSGLARSSVVRKLNIGDIDGAAEAFMAWAKPAALVVRRREEAAQFKRADAGGAAPHQIAADRAELLSARAAITKAKARQTQTAAVATASAGAGLWAIAGVAHHHPLGLVIAGLAALGAIVDGVVAWSRHAKAKVLATSAQTHVAAATLPSKSTAAVAPSIRV